MIPGVSRSLRVHALSRDVIVDDYPLRYSLVQFKEVRISFHQIVRSCQNLMYSDWQEVTVKLWFFNQRTVASKIRRTFRIWQVRRNQSYRVRRPDLSEVFYQEEITAQWRQYLIAVGTRCPDMFDHRMHETVMGRFAAMSESQQCGAFDASFQSNDLGRARVRCGDSVVGKDDLLLSLFQVIQSW